jgi:hypothetical protein
MENLTMTTVRVSFYDFNSNVIERTQKLLKPFFWKEAQENWKEFDGEIEIEKDGNHVLILTSEGWREYLVDFLKKQRKQIRSIEVLYQNESEIQFISDKSRNQLERSNNWRKGEYISI